MSLSLASIAYILGGLLVVLSLPALLFPLSWRGLLEKFPRSAAAGSLLTAVDLACVGFIVFHAPLGRYEPFKPALYVLVPTAFFLLVKFLDELLAPRALGALLLLAANPVLNIARWHDSEWRLVIASLAYVGIIIGTILVLSPYRFRYWIQFWNANPMRARAGGVLGCALGVAILGIGFRCF